MHRSLYVAGLLVAILFAGCLEGQDNGAELGNLDDALAGLLVPVTEPLWYNPQTFPHPAFNFPTLTNPPTDVSGSPWLAPIPPVDLPLPVSGMHHVARGEGVPRSAGMIVIGSLAVVPSNPTQIVDISDPEAPVVIGEYPIGARGADAIVYPDGRIVAVLATGGPDIVVLDITDPTDPEELSRAVVQRTHKVDVVPGTPIVYNSATREIYDLTDPAAPVLLDAQLPRGCHRTYFYIEPDREFYRAYCAGYDTTDIWDITDPRAPTLITRIPMWHGVQGVPSTTNTPTTFSHFSIASHDAKILIVGDEMGGGGMAACSAHVGTPAADASVPTGALWFYDISDERNPTLLSWLGPSTVLLTDGRLANCTAHHGRIVPEPDRYLLAMGYYGAGVILVDFTEPRTPRMIDQWNPGTNVWEVIYYNGYVVTGDLARGLDMLAFH